jgi:hypothetical protein
MPPIWIAALADIWIGFRQCLGFWVFMNVVYEVEWGIYVWSPQKPDAGFLLPPLSFASYTHSLLDSLTASMASYTAGSNLTSVVYPQGQVEGFRTLSVVLALTGERSAR